jgi:hypothetical protein
MKRKRETDSKQQHNRHMYRPARSGRLCTRNRREAAIWQTEIMDLDRQGRWHPQSLVTLSSLPLEEAEDIGIELSQTRLRCRRLGGIRQATRPEASEGNIAVGVKRQWLGIE